MSDLPTSLSALRDGAAVHSPAQRFLVRAAGPDLLPWLERLCSNPMQDIQPGECRRATLMDGKGKLRCDLRVLAPARDDDAPVDEVLLDLPASAHAAMLRLLDMFIIKEQVELSDLRDEFVHLALLGPGTDELLKSCGMRVAPPVGKLDQPRAEAFVVAENLAGTGGVELFVERAAARDMVDAFIAAGAVRATDDALEIARLERGTPRFDKDLTDGVIPLEAQLDDWVSTTKGCYPGQEVVARIRNLGQVARKLVRLEASGEHELSSDTELLGTGDHEGKPAGTLSSWAVDPVGARTLALAYLRRAHWKPGTQVRAGDATFTVHELRAG